MATGKPKRMGRAFARVAMGTLFGGALGTAVLFLVLTGWILDRSCQAGIAEAGRLCAAALLPGTDGDLSTSIDRLLSHATSLKAVGTLDSSGSLRAIYPEKGAYRLAAALTLDAKSGPVATGVTDSQGAGMLWGHVVALNGDDHATVRRILLLFADGSFQSTRLVAVGISSVLVFMAGAAGVWTLTGWFNRRVIRPLRHLAGAGHTDRQERMALPSYETHGWYEIERVAGSLRELRRAAVQSDGQRRRALYEAQRQIRNDRAGFDRQLRRAQDRALTDPLTGLRNRAFLDAQLEELFEEHRNGGPDLSIVMLDVDEFKGHNDTHGHAAGDDVLSFIGDLLQGTIRPTDHAVRYGGDEFLLVLPGTSGTQAAQIADRIVKLFRQGATSLGGDSHLALSAGVASIRQTDCDTVQALLKHADVALYAAKQAGKNGVAVYTPVAE